MRLLLLSAAVLAVAAPLAASADPDPGACATTINSKGVETTVCDPLGGSEHQPTCADAHPAALWPVVPYAKLCVAL